MGGAEAREESREIEEVSELKVSGDKEEMQIGNSHDGRFREIFNQVNVVPAVNLQIPPYDERINFNLEEKTELTDEEEDSAVQPLKRAHPPKVKDPGCIALSCALNDFDVEAMINLGSSINMMPTDFLTKIKGIVLKPSDLMVTMADGSVKIPVGMAEDVIVRVEQLEFLADFIVMDMDTDDEFPALVNKSRRIIHPKAREEPLRRGSKVKYKRKEWIIKELKEKGEVEIEAPYNRQVKRVDRRKLSR
ncbi:uncharacterized protein LOC106752825 [Vigna radiata var. radiata]|uniref:Uncharacterized protein LOC106752825 n=1 Tax=Vigna radiata var. radiata TaxID=3916 RepID=A0A1S3T8J4_VIGRR|nr:uncharacterized protein LOC106752825 [Vigna radiata var. radiata]